MNKVFPLIIATLLGGGNLKAQNATGDSNYRRSSLYSLIVNHTDQRFGEEIKNAFLDIEIPDKYNDHDLSVKILDMKEELKGTLSDKENETITRFLTDNQVASRLVGKWFNRDAFTGRCDVELVKARGLYNATEFDREMAAKSQRSRALLEDAGEELIGNTFVLVNDIYYVDKKDRGRAWGQVFNVLGQTAANQTGSTAYKDLGQSVSAMAETFKGFTVRINTFLYQLVWDEEAASTFYQQHYTSEPDEQRRMAFEQGRGTYKLRFVGKVESKGRNTSFLGINEDRPELMVLKACHRAIDENIADLGHDVETFRVRVPLSSTEPLTAPIGMKEGVTKDSQFEVLEVRENPDTGKRSYKRVGIIKPIPNLIWDNRFMAVEEGAPGANLGKTTFRSVSGSGFYPGMLIREI